MLAPVGCRTAVGPIACRNWTVFTDRTAGGGAETVRSVWCELWPEDHGVNCEDQLGTDRTAVADSLRLSHRDVCYARTLFDIPRLFRSDYFRSKWHTYMFVGMPACRVA